jgi:hypothetical protein
MKQLLDLKTQLSKDVNRNPNALNGLFNNFFSMFYFMLVILIFLDTPSSWLTTCTVQIMNLLLKLSEDPLVRIL